MKPYMIKDKLEFSLTSRLTLFERSARLAGLAGLTLVAGVQYGCSGDSAKQKPNIVILLADDMGWGDLHVNTNKIVETPVLDRLSAQSMSFDRFYVCPLSAPTRSEMLTGRYFLRTGVSSVTQGFENMRGDEVTIAEILKENGYATGCFGKWHNGGYYLQHPNRQGFDEFVGFCMGHLGYYYDALFLHNDEEIRAEGYTSDFFTDKALDFIEANKENPFLCYVPYNVPHSPFQVPEKYFNKYNSEGLDSTLSSVYGMVENMDENIGRILRKLDELDLSDNTIVIFFSDNGPNTIRYNGGMKGIKGSADEGGVRVPFYIRWPSVIKPGTTNQLAQDIDILPTILKLCGIKFDPQKPLDGMDLSRVILKEMAPTDRYIFSRQAFQNLENCNASVRNNEFRLVRTKNDTLLFNMIDDPDQKKNLADIEKETVMDLAGILGRWENELVSGYEPVTTIEAGFPEERSFILPVQDAKLSGNIKFSSIHPNQAHTEGWKQPGDSIYWNLDIVTGGTYKVELRYGCSATDIGSDFAIKSDKSICLFRIEDPFESLILPDRDYVKRSESVERTWTWMTIGNIELYSGNEQLVLKLLMPANSEAGLIKAIRLTRE
ncbi:MAG TPA: arylsulfatase [Bacteroidales bacterium]|nr:arylsulfatase [Bacteroidales bacterium]